MPLRLLRTDDTDEFIFEEINLERLARQQDLPLINAEASVKYAILSHRWRAEEVQYHDRNNIAHAKTKAGWTKLQAFKTIARQDGYDYIWLDTCCIDKTSSTEFAEALRSMFQWYKSAGKCYAYLDDVYASDQMGSLAKTCEFAPDSDPHPQLSLSLDPWSCTGDLFEEKSMEGIPPRSGDIEMQRIEVAKSSTGLTDASQTPPSGVLHSSEWFTRGWTLQEMIAPTHLVFYDAGWTPLGSLIEMADQVSAITKVDRDLLLGKRTIESFSVAQKMSWASKRRTTIIEDRAYSLLGLFDVSIPIIYGEGIGAFRRLQEELLKTSPDLTLFAWQPKSTEDRPGPSHPIQNSTDLLATSPDDFADCGRMVPIPSKHRSQAGQFTGGRLELTADIFEMTTVGKHAQRQTDKSYHAVLCCFDNILTQIVTLNLAPFDASSDLFVVDGSKSRLSIHDILLVSDQSRRRQVEVWRSESDAYSSQTRVEKDIVLIRCAPRVDGRESLLKVSGGEPRSEWNSLQQSLLVPDARLHHVEYRQAVFLVVAGRENIRVDVVHRFKNGKRRLEPLSYVFQLDDPGSSFWKGLQNLLLRYLNIYHCHLIGVNQRRAYLLHLEAIVLEFHLIDGPTAVYNFCRQIPEVLLRFVAVAIALGPAWLFIILPPSVLLVIYYVVAVRLLPSFVVPFDRVIALVLLGAILLCLGIVLTGVFHKFYGRGVRNIWGEAGSLYKAVAVVLRPWSIMIRSAVILGLCAAYYRSGKAHHDEFEQYDLARVREYHDLAHDGVAAYVVLAQIVFHGVVLLIPLPVIDILRFLAAVALAVPLLIFASGQLPYTTPWNAADCAKESINSLYHTWADRTGDFAEDVCRTFGREGNFLWILIISAILEAFSALSTIHRAEPQCTIPIFILQASAHATNFLQRLTLGRSVQLNTLFLLAHERVQPWAQKYPVRWRHGQDDLRAEPPSLDWHDRESRILL